MFGKYRTQFKLSLNDSVTALKNIRSDFRKPEKAVHNNPTPAKDADPPTYHKLRSGTMMTKRVGYKPLEFSSEHTRNPSGKYLSDHIPAEAGPKLGWVCRACGERDH